MKKLTSIVVAVAALFLASCSVPKNITYFQDVNNGSTINVQQPYMVKVQPGDKLRIYVSTQDQRLTEMFNLVSGTALNYNNQNTSNTIGYTVASDGTIDFPLIGSVKVAECTREEIAKKIKEEIQARDLVKEPVVVVDFLNMGVSVLGDVKSPGHFNISKDRYTVLEALADAGDLNITAQREHVKVIRQEVGKEQVYEINLLDAQSLYSSPAFFLQQNDVVYVDPNNKRKREATINGNTAFQYGFWISIASLLMSLSVIIFK